MMLIVEKILIISISMHNKLTEKNMLDKIKHKLNLREWIMHACPFTKIKNNYLYNLEDSQEKENQHIIYLL